MKITQTVCDKCGKTIEEQKQFEYALGFDFCNECYESAKGVLANWIKKKDEKKAKPQRKRIDWDKACALKLAGWSNHNIADELGCNESTVNVTIYSKLREYKAGKREEQKEEKEE